MAAHSPEQDMRGRIIQAAQHVIVKYGVAGATARSISAQANISPGTLTYHFKSVDEVLEAAFSRLAGQVSVQFRQRLLAAKDSTDAIEAVSDLICGNIVAAPSNMLMSFELYAYASRNPKIRLISQEWLRQSRNALSLHFDEKLAVMLDALIEGFTVHQHLSDETISRQEIQAFLTKLIST